MNFKFLIVSAMLLLPPTLTSGQKAYNTPGALNPFVPGYFADPTVKKFGDTYYIYATTDGCGAGFGPAQCWTSKDFLNWTLLPMNWPDSHWIWAPDVMRSSRDGRYYMVYCQPCNLYMGVSDTPRGPWRNILGESEAVLVPDRFVKNAITLDGQTFTDDDGEVYMYWGTWGIYKGFGCGAGRLNADMKSFAETRLIPNTEITDFFEAPFVMKRNGIYYLMYSSASCHDATYHVQYATADRPLGPYTYRGTILRTNADSTVHGPGHHSVLQEGDDYYIVYHRHDNPHSTRGFHRQLCIDRLTFNPDGSIAEVTPTHDGIGALGRPVTHGPNLAFGARVRASSSYGADFRADYAVDDNNGTLWRPASLGEEWLEIDLGKSVKIKTVMTQFEYATQYYRYFIETSTDGRRWQLFADKRKNRLAGSPMADFGEVQARYVRLTFTGGQKVGFGGGVWNIKVYGDNEDWAPQQWVGLTGADWNGRSWENNEGMLAGAFILTAGKARARRTAGKEALALEPGTTLTLTHALLSPHRPHTLTASILSADGSWRQAKEGDKHLQLKEGRLQISAGADTLFITNVRYYNRQQHPQETAFDATTDILRLPPAEAQRLGPVVDLRADDFAEGDTAHIIANHGIGGWLEPAGAACTVECREGRKAFRFTGSEVYNSTFAMPATLRDNTPYTLEAWILNPEMQENECVADFTTSHDELEKIMLVNGTEPRCGLLNHYGWYEDVGSRQAGQWADRWQHVYICFDGHIEEVRINGHIVSQKDIRLLVKPSQRLRLGLNNEGEWPFTGYLHALRLWDECLPYRPAPDDNN